MKSMTIKLSGFPGTVSAEEVTKFLEDNTGKDAVVALKVRPPRHTATSSALVIVQFTSNKFLEEITFKAQQCRLWYEGSRLTVRQGEHDIKPNPRTTMAKLENTVMHIGCLVAEDRFSSLWSITNVKVNFAFGLRKLQFFFPYLGFEYKLELFYESIREIQLHHQCGQATKFLPIKVCCLQLKTIVL